MTSIRQLILNIRAKISKYFVTREVLKTLSLAHAVELSSTLPENWPMVRDKHALQIAAVKQGKLDAGIVDRRSWPYPYLPSTLTRLQQPIIKLVPYNLRRFSKTPVPRRAINLIKNSITSLDWDIVPIENAQADTVQDQVSRIAAAKSCFEHPNNTDSFQILLERGIDDLCTIGALILEPQLTPDPRRPIKLWNVDATTIRFFPNWRESEPDIPKFAQMTGLKGERGIVVFYEDELLYVPDNPTVDTPFGTSKMEVAFKSVTAFLGVQEMSGRAGSDQVHRTWLWWENGATAPALDIIRRHIMNDVEGQAQINLLSGTKAPEVVTVQSVTPEDLLLPWQEFLVRMICLSFDLSAANFLERDLNRAVGEALLDADFRSAVVPTAVKIAEHFTRFILHKKLGWTDLEFKFLNIDDPDLETKINVLQKMYAMNGLTPNNMLRKLGEKPLDTPYADLTQIEVMIMMAQITAQQQNNNASKQFQRQQQGQQQMFQQQKEIAEQEQANEGEQQGSASIGIKKPSLPSMKQLKLPPPLKLPMMPMTGSRYSAHQVAEMSLSELKAAQKAGAVPSDPDELQQNMETQDPFILQQLAPDIQKYLEWLQQQKRQKDRVNQAKKNSTGADEEQNLKFRQSKHKPAVIEQTVWVNKTEDSSKPKVRSNVKKAFNDQRPGKGVEIAQTDVNKGKAKKRRLGQ